MTYIPDLLAATKTLIEKKATGPYNVINPGSMNPYRIMELYTEIVDPSHTFEKLELEDLSEVATAGRSNCVLDGKKLEDEGISMRPVEDAVREALEKLKNS
jgi:dTDP-4-dehydrorhamnose reductase